MSSKQPGNVSLQPPKNKRDIRVDCVTLCAENKYSYEEIKEKHREKPIAVSMFEPVDGEVLFDLLRKKVPITMFNLTKWRGDQINLSYLPLLAKDGEQYWRVAGHMPFTDQCRLWEIKDEITTSNPTRRLILMTRSIEDEKLIDEYLKKETVVPYDYEVENGFYWKEGWNYPGREGYQPYYHLVVLSQVWATDLPLYEKKIRFEDGFGWDVVTKMEKV